MRKIEMLMNTAIKNNTDWHMSNTRVDNNEGVSTVYLHNNKIAEIGEDFVRVFDGGWQSNTTKSRLNAIINEFCNGFTDGVFQKNFEWFVTDNNVTHDFVNGYTFAWWHIGGLFPPFFVNQRGFPHCLIIPCRTCPRLGQVRDCPLMLASPACVGV